ncbi:MAG: hypothetical protein Ct9H300mP32_6170 [Verrucomicrobiota bacterium]|nr:MAG: hypothetical protein Ct9H300mP32_6170 [Verrucomicrobiota bacterium]
MRVRVPARRAPDFVNEWVNWGAGLPRRPGAHPWGQGAHPVAGSFPPSPRDIKALAVPVPRHRILPNFKAEAEGVDADKVVEKLLETVPPP